MNEPVIRKKGKRGDYQAVAMRKVDHRAVRAYCDRYNLVMSDFLGAAARLGMRQGLGR